MLQAFPRIEVELFTGGAAWLVSVLSGVVMLRVDEGWALAFSGQPMVVTTACSATDFFLMIAALCGWHFAQWIRPRRLLPAAVSAALITAVPLTLFINALRIVAVAQAHCWVIPRVSPAYGYFLHMFTGVAVFLPALITLNLLLEIYGRSYTAARD